jgi:chemotaxis protein MotB
MTAMMAFFLVMWLVNAANEETKAAVASYFNPIKLMDDKPADKGIKQVGNSADGEANAPKSESKGEESTNGQAGDAGAQENSTAGEKQDYSEADYFENPYSVLSEIAQESGTQTNVSAKGDGGAAESGPATGASGGEAYRDPFDPDFWSQTVEHENQAIDESQSMFEVETFASNRLPENTPDEANLQDPADVDGNGNPDAGPAGEVLGQTPGEGGTGALTPEELAAQVAEQVTGQMAEAEVLKDEITKALGGALGKLAEGLIVEPAEGGLLVSITDQLDFGMFNVGSAVPGRDLVLAMEKIGEVLAERNGAIAIRGHTDARPFASGTDDNWRLSLARAHSAYYMLVRGGVPEERINQVSGFADRRLKDPDDPYSEVNRRIEILVEAEGT